MIIDLGFLIFLMYGFYLGYSRGILKTLFAILSIFIAIIISFKVSPIMIDVVESFLKLGSQISFIVGFVISFLIVMFLVRFLGRKVEKLFKAVKLNFVNKIVGGVMMAMIFVISFSALVWFLNQTKLVSEAQKEQSISYTYLEPIPEQARGVVDQLKPAFKGFWEKSKAAMDDSDNTPNPPANENIPEQ